MNRPYRKRVAFGIRAGLSKAAAGILSGLSTPGDIQDFVSALDANREKGGHTLKSAAQTLKHRNAHCLEGAFVAAAALWLGGAPPLLMDMQAKDDDDHVIALFRSHGCWGAISKSNHVWLRWRDPVYRTLRELAMSYFHEYAAAREKTLRAYSVPFDLRRVPAEQWLTGEEPCWDTGAALDDSRHYKLITPALAKTLKHRDALQMRANKLTEH